MGPCPALHSLRIGHLKKKYLPACVGRPPSIWSQLAPLYRWVGLAALLLISAAAFNPSRLPEESSPNQVPLRFERIGPFGGDVRSVLIDRRLSSHVYIGTSDGRIFKSTDAGKSWAVLSPGIGRKQFVIDRLIQHPSDPDHIYACAWDLKSSGGGLFESLDAGSTWTQVALPLDSVATRDLAICKSRPSFMIVGTLQGAYLSRDSGKTWTLAGESSDKVESVAIDPVNPDYIYIGTWRLGYRSEDFGKTFARMEQGIALDSDLFSIVVDNRNPQVVFASACSGVYRSVNRGATWTRLRVLPDRLTVRAQVVALDPSDSHRVFCGTTEGLFISANEGSTWTRATSPHVTVNALQVDPANAKRVFLGSEEQGVLRSDDGGQTWGEYNSGFVHRGVSKITPDTQRPGFYLARVSPAGAQGSGYLFNEGKNQWTSVREEFGAGTEVLSFLFLPNKLGRLAGTSRGIYWQKEASSTWAKLVGPVENRAVYDLVFDTVQSRVIAGTDKGIYRTQAHDFKFRVPEEDGFIPKVSSIVISPANPNILYAAAHLGVMRSLDRGATWRLTSAGLPIRAIIECVTPCPAHKDHILLGTSLGLFESRNGGDTWQSVSDGRLGVDVTSVIFADPSGRNVIAADGTFGGIFISVDGGKQWQKAEAKDFSSPVRCIVRDPGNPSKFYLGTSSEGVYRLSLLSGALYGEIGSASPDLMSSQKDSEQSTLSH